MKHYIIGLLLLAASMQQLSAQTTLTYSFTYDEAGNRTGRTVTQVGAGGLLKGAQSLVENGTLSPEAKPYGDFIDNLQLELFPNPTMGELVIALKSTNTGIPVIRYNLVDLNGKTVQKLKSKEAYLVLDLSHLPPGHYMLHLRVGHKTKTYQVVKQ